MDSFNCFGNYLGNGQYQVHTFVGSMFVLCGIPCPHAISAIARKEASPQEFVHSLYERPAYDRCYEGYIASMTRKEQWKRTYLWPIKPSFYHKQPGKPKGKRIKAPYEIKNGATKLRKYDVVMHCQTCGEEGHNKTSCPQSHRRTVGTSISKGSSSNAKGPKATKGNNTIRGLSSKAKGLSTIAKETGARHHSGAAPSQTRPQGTSKLHVNRGGRVNQVTKKANEMASQPQHVAKKARPWRV
ncbi:hypothetical protein D8674_013474 [Pyrus ussuriensis x Pyrus communis]|uniref:CCHC-type domain-containing protein n=1 Tax=Pyrus ussuriensis x Pyrus communis TaxID=2448454 RepID=A0A5N5GPV7_9ROSA|nr:hypothetical protein D8674_013474 [Pyrus ussuriensis x Pyrus communis]